MDAVYQKRIGNFELVIKRDDDAPSPRDGDNVGQAIVAEVKSLDEYYVYGGYMYEVIEYKKCDCCGHEEEVEADTCCGFVGRLDGEDGVKEQIRWQLADEHKALIEDW